MIERLALKIVQQIAVYYVRHEKRSKEWSRVFNAAFDTLTSEELINEDN